ncbi:MAG: hypothetical protein ABSD89_12190 [Halobacteriota archaeon]|jgi:hypothetical protein
MIITDLNGKAVNIIADMMMGNYEKSEHVHICTKCKAEYPHDVKDCQWPKPWYCPDCEME